MSRSRAHRLALAGLAMLVCAMASGAVGAQERGASPTIALSTPRASIGEPVHVSITGFKAGSVVLTVCGNAAVRRSMDCNQVGGEGRRLNDTSGTTVTDLPISAPPTSCPCLVMAASTNFAEVATAPIEVIGHPVGPIKGLEGLEPLAVQIDVQRAGGGILDGVRAALGGPTAYDVTVRVRNASAEVLSEITLAGAAGRSVDDDMTDLDIPSVGTLEPGQTWEGATTATLPAPVVGGFVWHVTASGVGRSATAVEEVDRVPPALVVLVAVLLVDVGALVARRRALRRARRASAAAGA